MQSTRGYEFDGHENSIVSDLSKKMSFVGAVTVILGLLGVGFGLVSFFLSALGPGVGVGYVVQGVLNVLIGMWSRSAATSFQRIVDTQGSDIPNLLQALGELRRIYTLQRTVYIVAIVLLALAIALVVGTTLMTPKMG
jgi:hypothetical protein